MDAELRNLIDEQRVANAAALSRPAPLAGAATAAAIRRQRLYGRDGTFRHFRAPGAYDATLNTLAGPVLSRTFPVPDRRGTILHFHGGGWALGSVYEQDRLLADLARATRCAVVSIDYPLAPETRLPETLAVATAAICAVIAGRDGEPFGLVGESAGAHVALGAVQRLSAHPGVLRPIRALSLSYGIYDLSMTPSQRAWGDAFLGLSTPWLEWFYAQTLPDHSRDQRRDPALSPLYGNLRDLPPVQLSVGTRDPLLDDSRLLFDRLIAEGNRATLHLYPEAPHGFNHADSGMARYGNRRIAAFLGIHLADDSAAKGPASARDR